MDPKTVFLAVLVVAILTAGSFSLGEGRSGPLASPPNPDAEFGVLREQRSFLSFPTFSYTPNARDEDDDDEPSTKQLLKISRRGALSREINREYIDISYVASDAKNPPTINLTHYVLTNSRGERFTLSGAVAIPGLAPPLTDQNLIIPQGGTVHIVTGMSPLGANFRTNKCAAYLEQPYEFEPPFLRQSCPNPREESGQDDLTDRCFSYLQRVSSCETPTNLPLDLDNQCRDYISKTLNYDGCVKKHRTDKDFLGNEWWIYLSRSLPAWSDVRDTITLFDPTGTLVASLEYN